MFHCGTGCCCLPRYLHDTSLVRRPFCLVLCTLNPHSPPTTCGLHKISSTSHKQLPALSCFPSSSLHSQPFSSYFLLTYTHFIFDSSSFSSPSPSSPFPFTSLHFTSLLSLLFSLLTPTQYILEPHQKLLVRLVLLLLERFFEACSYYLCIKSIFPIPYSWSHHVGPVRAPSPCYSP